MGDSLKSFRAEVAAMFEADFLHLMTQVATYLPATGQDNYGKSSFGPGVNLPAHIMYKTTINYGSEEENQTSNAQVIIPPPGYVWDDVVDALMTTVPTIGTLDQFSLPDGNTRHVLWAQVYFDGGGALPPDDLLWTGLIGMTR